MSHTQVIPPNVWTRIDTELDDFEMFHEADGDVTITINDGPPVVSFDAENPPPPGLLTRSAES